jgi:hypothetical protein
MLCKLKKDLMSHPRSKVFRRKPSDHFFKDNRSKFTECFNSMCELSNPYLFLKGPIEEPIYDDDMNYPVVPENFFYYMTGCAEANTYAIYNVLDQIMYLFVKLPDSTKAFWEKHKTIEDMKKEYHLDTVYKYEQLEEIFRDKVPKETATVLTYAGTNPYSNLPTLNAGDDFQVIHLYKFGVDYLFFRIC